MKEKILNQMAKKGGKAVTYPDQSNYDELTQREHVLQAPEMYIDSIIREPREEYLLIEDKMVKTEIDIPYGLDRIFKELTSNVADNTAKSRRAGYNPGTCTVDVDIKKNIVKIKNEGLPIPVEKKEKGNGKGKYIPTMIFGSMLAGSSFDEDREDGGRNGIGSKACNIYSLIFTVNIQDHIRGKKFKQTWRNNMNDCDEPDIEDYIGKKSFVEIEYKVDIERFGYKNYPPEITNLFAAICAILSFTVEIPVIFNDKRMNYSDIKDYAALYCGKTNKSVVHYEWAKDVTVIKKKNGCEEAKDGSLPLVKFIVVDSPDNGMALGYANAIINSEGGVHVDSALKACTGPILEILNNPKIKKKKKGQDHFSKKEKISEEKKEKKSNIGSPKLNIRDVRPHLTIIISVRVKKPIWGNGQTKTLFKGPNPKITIPENKLNGIKTWDLVKKLKSILNGKSTKLISKLDGKAGYVYSEKCENANNSHNPSLASQCTLIIIEGDSASAYAEVYVGLCKGGRDWFGILPIRGKMRNVMNAKIEDLVENAEIGEIMKSLGLKYGVDYSVEKNRKKLRYGKVMIMTDADKDGFHITCLLIVFFHVLFPGLVESGDFIVQYFSPYLIVSKPGGKQTVKFYHEKEYNEWKKKTKDAHLWKDHRYLKGLGTSSDADVKENFATQKVVNMIYDKNAAQKLIMAFDKSHADERKQWMAEWEADKPIKPFKSKIPISLYIDEFLRDYAVSTLARQISGIDGLTETRRKIVWTMFKAWGRNCKGNSNYRVNDFAAKVSKYTNYTHGDGIPKIVTNMAQWFVGSNNMPFLTGIGQFGSRTEMGKNAASGRYTHVKGMWWIPLVIKPEDDALLEMLGTEKEPIEPKFFLPIYPLELINGTDGISTGYKSKIPNYHPMEVVSMMIRCIRGKPLKELVPWYRNFTGDIDIVESISNKTGLPKRSMITTGVLSHLTDNSYTLIDLPIGKSSKSYDLFLMKLMAEGKIEDKRNNCDNEVVKFTVTGMNLKDEKGNPRPINNDDIKLTKAMGLNNMTLLNEYGIPINYEGTTDIIKKYHDFRLPYYQKRKDNLIVKMKAEIKQISDRINYIEAIINGDLVISKGNRQTRNKQDILNDIKRLELDERFFHTGKKEKAINNVTVEEKFPEQKIKNIYRVVQDSEKSTERVNKLIQNRKDKQKELAELKIIDIKTIWINDLEEFKKEYINVYGNDERAIIVRC